MRRAPRSWLNRVSSASCESEPWRWRHYYRPVWFDGVGIRGFAETGSRVTAESGGVEMKGSEAGLFYSKSESEHCRENRIKELVLAAQSGCASSFAEIREMYWRRLFRTVLSITRNPEDAEDVLQETFLRAFTALKSFEGRSAFYTWLTQIAINSSLMLLRRRHRHLEIPLTVVAGSSSEGSRSIDWDVEDPSPSTEQICSRRQMQILLIGAVGRLDPRLRTVLEIHLRRECSLSDLGRDLNISEAAAKSRLYRARRRLTLARVVGNGRTGGLPKSESKTSALNVM